MPERPDKWVDPAIYAEQRRLVFRLYMGVHWDMDGNEKRRPNTRPQPKRKLRPEIQEWLDNHDFPFRLVLKGGGQSRIIFEKKEHAMLFKLTWI